ncbi:MAG: hypothetical protein ACRCSN_03480, partial [Dermatophilaceae bacterium]
VAVAGRRPEPVTELAVSPDEDPLIALRLDRDAGRAAVRLHGEVVVTLALAAARTRVCQSVDRFELELPDVSLGAVTRLVGRSGGVLLSRLAGDGAATRSGAGHTRPAGNLPATAVPDLAVRLPDLTGGEGVLTRRLDHYAPVSSATPPTRRRLGPDPGDRDTRFRERPR